MRTNGKPQKITAPTDNSVSNDADILTKGIVKKLFLGSKNESLSERQDRNSYHDTRASREFSTPKGYAQLNSATFVKRVPLSVNISPIELD